MQIIAELSRESNFIPFDRGMSAKYYTRRAEHQHRSSGIGGRNWRARAYIINWAGGSVREAARARLGPRAIGTNDYIPEGRSPEDWYLGGIQYRHYIISVFPRLLEDPDKRQNKSKILKISSITTFLPFSNSSIYLPYTNPYKSMALRAGIIKPELRNNKMMPCTKSLK